MSSNQALSVHVTSQRDLLAAQMGCSLWQEQTELCVCVQYIKTALVRLNLSIDGQTVTAHDKLPLTMSLDRVLTGQGMSVD